METEYNQYQINNIDLNADKIHDIKRVKISDYQTLTLKTEMLSCRVCVYGHFDLIPAFLYFKIFFFQSLFFYSTFFPSN